MVSQVASTMKRLSKARRIVREVAANASQRHGWTQVERLAVLEVIDKMLDDLEEFVELLKS
jgi:hypothetical protein